MDEKKFIQKLFDNSRGSCAFFPDKDIAEKFIDDLFDLLFASDMMEYASEQQLYNKYQELKNTLVVLLYEVLKNEKAVTEQCRVFFEAVPAIHDALLLDAEAILNFDPAATSLEEVMLAYPGFYATAIYRFAHQLHLQKIKILPRLLSEYGHGETGIDIHPGAEIGASFFIDHGTGVVIGESAVIGNNVKVYQGVTLGALNVNKDMASSKRHPTIEDDVIIYSGATILGGNTVVGKGSVIGGNVWLTYSVPPQSIVYHKSEIKIKDNQPLPEVLNFVI